MRSTTFAMALLAIMIAPAGATLTAQSLTIQQRSFHQLIVDDSTGKQRRSTIGRIDMVYLPPPQDLFLNIVATVTPSNPNATAWIARNVYIPDSSWNPIPQMLSITFDLRDLGLNGGDSIGFLLFEASTTRQALTQAPTATPSGLETAVVTFERFRIGGISSFDSQPAIPAGGFTQELPLPVDLTGDSLRIYYEGCRIPNVDLDSSAHPGDINGCGPAAIANSMKWLDLMDTTYSLPELRSLYEQINQFMSREPDSTASLERLIKGKLALIEAYNLPLCVTYQTFDQNSRTGILTKSDTKNSSATQENTQIYPTWEWMAEHLRKKCDVELVVVGPGHVQHAVTLSGTARLQRGPDTRWRIRYKHDADQPGPGGTIQEAHPVVVQSEFGGTNDTTMVVHGFWSDGSSGTVSAVVTECRCNGNQPQPPTGTWTFRRFCDVHSFTILPQDSIAFEFPTDPAGKRGYMVTLYRMRYPLSGNPDKLRTWSNNSGRRTTYHNGSNQPVIIWLHDDDADPNAWTFTYAIGATKRTMKRPDPLPQSSVDDILTPSSPAEIAGFSVGWRDSSGNEFGAPPGPAVTFNANDGCNLAGSPSILGKGEVERLTLTYDISEWNPLWKSLELRLGVDSVLIPGRVALNSTATGASDTILLTSAGEYVKALGGLSATGTFDLRIEPLDQTQFRVDYIGIPAVPGSASVEPVDITSPGLSLSLYPNPASGSVTARLATQRSVRVRLTVANERGEMMGTLFDGILRPGERTFQFDGNSLAEGTYIISAEADGTRRSEKLMVVHK